MTSKCCAIKGVLAIAAYSVIAYLSGYTWHVFEAAWNTEYLKPIFRPADAQHWQWLPAAFILQGIVFVGIYSCLGRSLVCCKCKFSRGALFGLKIWLIAAFCGSVFWFITENITTDVVVLNLAQQFIAFVIGGAAVSKILGDMWCGEGESQASCGTEKNHCGGKNHCGANG